MERAQRFYDCITEIGDRYIQDAEEYTPTQNKSRPIAWRRWTGMAAALVLVVGLSFAVYYLPRMGGATSGVAAEMPAMSAPAAAAPEAAPMEPAPGGSLMDKVEAAPAAPEQAAVCGMPEDLAAEVEGKTPMWLEFTGEWYVPTEGPSAYALFAYSPDLGIISDGTDYYAVAVQYMP